jgi:hypothetical protein
LIFFALLAQLKPGHHQVKLMTPSPAPAPFASAHRRAVLVKILLVVGGIATGVSLLGQALTFVYPPLGDDQEVGDNPIGAVVMLVTFLLALISLVIYLTTVVVFLMWLYRAYGNLRAFNPWSRLQYSRGWALGSFFIPFANLIIPYRAVKEVWEKSVPPDEAMLSNPEPPAYFGVWWLFWLLAGFAGNASMRLSLDDHASPSTAAIVSIIADALSMIAAVFAYLVVDSIDKRQEETTAKLRLTDFPGPPPPPTDFSMPNVVAPAPNTSEQG